MKEDQNFEKYKIEGIKLKIKNRGIKFILNQNKRVKPHLTFKPIFFYKTS